MTQRIELTVREYAALERVTPKTVWRWIDKGALNVRRTHGGRIRIIQIDGQSRPSAPKEGQSAK